MSVVEEPQVKENDQHEIISAALHDKKDPAHSEKSSELVRTATTLETKFLSVIGDGIIISDPKDFLNNLNDQTVEMRKRNIQLEKLYRGVLLQRHDLNDHSKVPLSTFANVADLYVRWFGSHPRFFLAFSTVVILLWFFLWMYIDYYYGTEGHIVGNFLYLFIYCFLLYYYLASQKMYQKTKRCSPLSSDWYITNREREGVPTAELYCCPCFTPRSENRQHCYFEWFDQSTKYYWQLAEEDVRSPPPHTPFTPLPNSGDHDADLENLIVPSLELSRLRSSRLCVSRPSPSEQGLEVIGHRWHREQNLFPVTAIKWLGYTLMTFTAAIVPAIMGVRTWLFYERCNIRNSYREHCDDKDFILLTSIGNVVVCLLFWMVAWIASSAFLIFMDTLGHIRHVLIVYLQNLKFIAMHKELGSDDEVKVTYKDAVPFYNNIASYVHILSRIWQRLLTAAMIILLLYMVHQLYKLWTDSWDFVTIIVVSVTFFLLSWSLLWIGYVNTMGDRIITWFTAVELEKSFIRATRNDISEIDENQALISGQRNASAAETTEELLTSMIFMDHIKYTDVKFKIYGWKPHLGEIFRAVVAGSVSLVLTGARVYYTNTGDE